MEPIAAALQDNPFYLGILIGLCALFVVSLAKRLIQVALIAAIALAGMFYFVHGQAPEPTGLGKLQEVLRDNVPEDLGERIRNTSKEAAAGLAEKSKEAAESLAEKIAEATNEVAKEELLKAAESAKESLQATAEKAGEQAREISEKVKERVQQVEEQSAP